MSFNKKLISAAVLASFVFAGNAFADEGKKSATVTFKAQLREAACDVTSTTEGDTINFGIFTLDTLQAAAVESQVGTTKDFDLVLNNCSKAADPAKVYVYADGQASSYSSKYFANKTAKSLAVQIFHGNDASTGTIEPNKDTQLTGIVKMDEGSNASIPLKANLILTQAGKDAKADILNVPVTFSVSYN
ncbi:fimbrial protein [Proteus sp. ZN5]|uniref:fimbrial protein n=1 Tax=Proteus sp. ZN5 TaxID=2697019 RepID=UPI0013E1D0D1|nr:fimbrial protein [Proteus sp. ZN5]QIG04344.1 fimbrial protein [Proteus sp. ZN5]